MIKIYVELESLVLVEMQCFQYYLIYRKVELDEPYYWVNVDGDRVKLDNIDYLMEQRLFRRTVAKQINKKPPRE